MGEFDDVLAMESGDDWGDYQRGAQLDAGHLPVVAVLRLPHLSLTIRGELPPDVRRALAPLGGSPAANDAEVTSATVTVEPAGARHRVVDHDRGEQAGAGSDAELLEHLLARFTELVHQADSSLVPLRGAAVELPDGRGVFITGAERVDRHRLVRALLGAGAGYLGADVVLAQSGSRAVHAVPTPLVDSDDPIELEQVTQVTTISSVVVLDAPDGAAAARLERPYACARLLSRAMSGAGDRDELVRTVALLVAGADAWELPAQIPVGAEDTAGSVLSLADSHHREVVTLRRPLRERPEQVVVRFATGAVLVDTADAVVFELAPEELPTVDSLRWPVVAADPAVDDRVLRALADAGIDLGPARSAGVQRAPGPEGFALPDAPTASAAAALWDAGAAAAALAQAPELAPLLLYASQHGVLALDELSGPAVSDQAAASSTRAQRTAATLERILGHLTDATMQPLVLGSVVDAADGPLPDHLVPVDGVELLCAPEDLLRCAQVLEAGGAVRLATSDEAASLEHRVELLEGDGVPVVLRSRLAAGPFGELVDHEALFERSVPIRIAGRWARALHPHDRFVWACVRLGDEREPSPTAVRAAVLTAPWSRQGCAQALDASARWGATRTVLAAVRTAAVRLPGMPPWLVERAERPEAGTDRRRRRGRRRG